MKQINEDDITVSEDTEYNTDEDDFFAEINNHLSEQVTEELSDTDDAVEDKDKNEDTNKDEDKDNAIKKHKIIKCVLAVLGIFVILTAFIFGTKPGRNILGYKIIAGIIRKWIPTQEQEPEGIIIDITQDNNTLNNLDTTDNSENNNYMSNTNIARKEEHVLTCLIYGIEEIYNARNTDSMLLVSINSKTKQISIVSLLRDTIIETEKYGACKLNSIYSNGTRAEGARLLKEIIEQFYHIKIDAYASVNFDKFEAIIDYIGGITIELGKEEAAYLRKENYISNVKYRNVYEGMQSLNGNQVLGYSRIRKVPTIGGATDDYGRTLRQRKVLRAIYDKYRGKNIFEQLTAANKCLELVTSDITSKQIEEVLKLLVDGNISDVESFRLPINGTYYDSGTVSYKGNTYALVTDFEANTKEIYMKLFGDSEEEAEANLRKYQDGQD